MANFHITRNDHWKREQVHVTLRLGARKDQTFSVSFMIFTFLVSEIL